LCYTYDTGRMIALYFENIFISGVRAAFSDAVFTLYRIDVEINKDDENVQCIYHSHFYYEIHVVLEGSALYMIQGNTVSVSGGMMMIIPPHIEHYPFQENAVYRAIVLGLTLEQKEPESDAYQYFMSTLCGVVNKPIALSPDLLSDIINFYSSFQSTETRKIFFRQAAAYSIIYKLFDSINHFHISSSSPETIQEDQNRDISLELLINEWQYSLQDIAKELGYSTRHTSRLIRQKYGKSLREIRQKNMVSTVKKLLIQSPPLSLEAITIQSGFTSMDAMVRAFKKYENKTPTEYRKIMESK